jgi:chaperonin GroEL
MEGGLKVAAIPAPGVGKTKDTWLKDIEVASGAIIISEKGGQGIKNFNQDNLGSAAKVRATEHTCEIIGGAYDPEEKEARIRTIKNQLDEAKQPQSISFYKDRLSRLDGGVAIIHVGATTEVELKEKKDLFEDAIAATKAAAAEGILPGGGSSLAQISMSVANLRGNNQGEQDGINVLVQAMREPLITIMENAGLDGRQILNTVLSIDEPMLLERIWNYFFNKNKEKANTNFNYGFNLNTNKYCDMVKAGILDTAKVERLALENSSSVASMMLMTDTLIYTKNPE